MGGSFTSNLEMLSCICACAHAISVCMCLLTDVAVLGVSVSVGLSHSLCTYLLKTKEADWIYFQCCRFKMCSFHVNKTILLTTESEKLSTSVRPLDFKQQILLEKQQVKMTSKQ